MRFGTCTLVLLAVSACGAPPRIGQKDRPEKLGAARAAIVNGQDDPGDPAVVYVDLGGGSCSGTLISPTTVLTAMHCTEGVDNASMHVLFGSDASNPSQTIQVADHEDNPNGQPGGGGDLSLLTLASPGPAQPVAPNEKDPSNMIGADVRIAGFGVTSDQGNDSGIKRQGKTTITHVEAGLIYEAEQPSSICYGDSGGPSFLTIGGVEYVAAATSFTTDACGQGEAGVARTDDSIKWIKGYVSMHDPNWNGSSSASAASSSSAGSGGAGPSASASSSAESSSAESSSASGAGPSTHAAATAASGTGAGGAWAAQSGAGAGNGEAPGGPTSGGSCAIQPGRGGGWTGLALLAMALMLGIRKRIRKQQHHRRSTVWRLTRDGSLSSRSLASLRRAAGSGQQPRCLATQRARHDCRT